MFLCQIYNIVCLYTNVYKSLFQKSKSDKKSRNLRRRKDEESSESDG